MSRKDSATELSQFLAKAEARAKSAGLSAGLRVGSNELHGHPSWLSIWNPGDDSGLTIFDLGNGPSIVQHAKTNSHLAAVSPGALLLAASEVERMRRVVLDKLDGRDLPASEVAVLADRLRELGVPEWRVRCVVALLGGAP